MDDGKTYDEASKVEAKAGDVTVKGPDGVDVKLTPDAAMEIADRLTEGAAEAHGQRIRRGGRDTHR